MARKLLVALLISLVAPNILGMPPKKVTSLGDLDKQDEEKARDKPDWREAAQRLMGLAKNQINSEEDQTGFNGEGRRLDEVRPEFTSALKSNDDGSEDGNSDEENEQHAIAMLCLDESQPTTTIKIRLADDEGTVITARFNLVHSIEDIRTYIINAHPVYASENFDLFTAAPSKQLTEADQTIKKAGLAQSCIVVKLSAKPKKKLTYVHDSDNEMPDNESEDDSFDEGSFGDDDD